MNRYLFYGLLVLGIAMRVVLLARYELVNGGEVDVYLADEGIVGVMGMHILAGRELPVFFYGQHYLGALEAYLAAASFAVFGVGFTSLRLVPLMFSLGLLGVVYDFTYRAYSVAAARWATVLLAVSPAYFLEWNLKARGGFVEHVFLLCLVMLLFWRFHLYHDRSRSLAIALGLSAGIALWVNQLMLAYLIVLGGLLLFSGDRRWLGTVLAALLVGSSLLIAYNVVHPLATARSLGRKAIVLNRVPIEDRDESWVVRGVGKRVEALRHGADKLGLVFGVPPREGVEKLGLTPEEREGSALTDVRRNLWFIPLLVFGVAFLACRPRRGAGGWGPFASDQILGLLALVTFVVGYVSPRYMLPAYPLAAIMVGVLATRVDASRRTVMTAALAAVLGFNILGWVDNMVVRGGARDDRGERLLARLEAEGLTRCYSAAPLYHLVFESEEGVVFSPLQKDRYPAYNAEVERAESICYVFRDDQRSKRQHVAMMRYLEDEGIAYSTATSEPYRILYAFTPRKRLSGEAIARIRHQERAQVTHGRTGDSG